MRVQCPASSRERRKTRASEGTCREYQMCQTRSRVIPNILYCNIKYMRWPNYASGTFGENQQKAEINQKIHVAGTSYNCFRIKEIILRTVFAIIFYHSQRKKFDEVSQTFLSKVTPTSNPLPTVTMSGYWGGGEYLRWPHQSDFPSEWASPFPVKNRLHLLFTFFYLFYWGGGEREREREAACVDGYYGHFNNFSVILSWWKGMIIMKDCGQRNSAY